ncbi:MAG: hypothetical protein CUN56_04785, partial [Phototrophicales bacterium]
MPLDLKKVFSSRVRKALGDRSMNWLAFETGLSVKTISFYLNEERPDLPKANNLRALCEALNVSADHLLGLPQPIIPSSRAEILDSVHRVKSSMLATHYALIPEEVHRWKQGDAVQYYDANCRLVAQGKTVERVFILRRYAFFDPKTGRFDEQSLHILSEQAQNLTQVIVVWEEVVKQHQNNDEWLLHSQLQIYDSNLLIDIILIDEDLLFINRNPGFTLTTWIPDKTTCATRVENHLNKFKALKSIGID